MSKRREKEKWLSAHRDQFEFVWNWNQSIPSASYWNTASDWTILPKYKGWLDFERVCNCMELSLTCSNHHKTERQNTTETKQLFRAHKKKDNSCLHMLSLQNRRVYASQHLESWKKDSNVIRKIVTQWLKIGHMVDLEGLNPPDPILILFQRHRLVHNDLHNKLHLQFNLNRVWSPCCHQVIKGGINLGMASYFIISSLMLITMPMLSMSMTKTMVLMGTASYLASSVSSLDNSPHLTPGSLQPPSYNGW